MFVGDRYNYSLNKIFYLFSFFFFGIAPILQFQYGIVMWGGTGFNVDSFYHLNILILLILFLYQGFYFIFSKIEIFSSKKLKNKKQNMQISNRGLLLISFLALLVTLHINNYSIENLIFRSTNLLEDTSINQSVYLIFSKFLLPIPVIALVIFKKFELEGKLIEIFLVGIVLITNFPTSNARFYIAAMYIPLLIVYFQQFNKKYLLLNKLIMIGLLILFPLLNQARRISSLSEVKFTLNFEMFLKGHFDTYQMFMKVVENDIVTMGSQLLTSLFFFIPSSLWPEKSIGSGAFVSHLLGLSYDNVSMNYFGEGYINFGYIGILMFIIILAFINAKIDRSYWHNLMKNKKNLLSVIYLFLLGLEFFILRGALLSSFAYTVGIVSSILFVFIICKKRIIRSS